MSVERYQLTVNSINAKVIEIATSSSSFTEQYIFRRIYSDNKSINGRAKDQSVKLVRRTKSGMSPNDNRQIMLRTIIFQPLSAEKADELNHNNSELGLKVGATVGGVAGLLISRSIPNTKKLDTTRGVSKIGVGALVGSYVRQFVINNVRKHHLGDVWIYSEVLVNGGIGPQKTIITSVLRSTEY